eukprot:CAMPEP_0202091446 /NCGR_PEP_ID=MMETSP0964-20121228/46085_1 /ASSEMBLY_ACC=CAM_ASM_000500 /TAXON_ID=4773 /ORGANISM="Schizochytrium aggregatum, Strain ATCC28209" /LENGTH=53 /DNA_ID=CAMNT_0048659633 /DNA_START=22 /DNA_END=179 /DNA_ORIENTATION=-
MALRLVCDRSGHTRISRVKDCNISSAWLRFDPLRTLLQSSAAAVPQSATHQLA